MKKIEVETERCLGCGACFGIDEEHFSPNDEGFSTVISNDNLDSILLQEAIEACPIGIISIEEDKEENISE